MSIQEKKPVLNIIEYIAQSTRLTLTPVQKFLLKVMYGIPLDDTQTFPVRTWWGSDNTEDFTEVTYLRRLYAENRSNFENQEDLVSENSFSPHFVGSLGRRSGKILLIACIASYEVYKLLNECDNPQAYYGLPASNDLNVRVIATAKDQARILKNEVASQMRVDGFWPSEANSTQSYTRFQTAHDVETTGWYSEDPKARASIKLAFQSCAVHGLKGSGNKALILDEIAWYASEGENVAEEVYTALMPTTAGFSPKDETGWRSIGPSEGRVVCFSSPAGKQGFFYKLFCRGFGMPCMTGMISLQIPTWEMNPSIPVSSFEEAYDRDEDVFRAEYGAEFLDVTKCPHCGHNL